MSTSSSLYRLVGHIPPPRQSMTSAPAISFMRLFSTSSSCEARKSSGGNVAAAIAAAGGAAAKKRKGQAAKSENYARIKVLKKNMFSKAPPPLRMARLRHLRHWTIHRAWQLFRRQQREATEKERYRMHAGMFNACEELRMTAGPGSRGEGYLYRVAMEKKNVYGAQSIPIEYARCQSDYPAKQAWDHDWKRS